MSIDTVKSSAAHYANAAKENVVKAKDTVVQAGTRVITKVGELGTALWNLVVRVCKSAYNSIASGCSWVKDQAVSGYNKLANAVWRKAPEDDTTKKSSGFCVIS